MAVVQEKVDVYDIRNMHKLFSINMNSSLGKLCGGIFSQIFPESGTRELVPGVFD